jgi:MoaA/NifB/PqqE/SkfB family radical SAM enzyme
MARILIELTNRCNLRCQHCYDERHASSGDLPLAIIEKVLSEGKHCGIDHISFTGGEPTIHPYFPEIVSRVCGAGYKFGFVSNGISFPKIYSLLIHNRSWFRGVTFSLDGAKAQTHDRLRGKGSFRRVMRAASICVFRNIPFTFNMVLTAQNREEIADMVQLADQLGSGGVRFGHLMSIPNTTKHGLDLSAQERREVESQIWRLQKTSPLPVGMAPGYYSDSPFFPCGPLELEEFNLDYRGNLTLCCHLSGYAGRNSDKDVMGNLYKTSLSEACARFRAYVATYLADKYERVRLKELSELDHFPCMYCVKYVGKVPFSGDFLSCA